MTDVRTIYRGLVFPECPRWHNDALWFSDCHDGQVLAIDSDGHLLDSFVVPGNPAGLGWLPDGTLLVVSIDHICIYRRGADGKLTRHADLSVVHRFHTNDMVVDAGGNAYVGEVAFRIGTEGERTTVIALVRPDGSVEVATDGMTTPNGAAFTADGKSFVVAQSLLRRISVFDVAADGLLVNGRLFAQLGEEEIPDGICLDIEGFAWVTSPFTGAVLRVSPTGEVVDRITLTEAQPYACVFGGPDRRDLFICCASTHDPSKARAARSGTIVVARPGVAGGGNP